MMIPGGGLEKTVQKQKRYSEKFKSRMIQRMTGRRRMSAGALSKEVGVAQPTLSLWLREASSLSVVNDDDEKQKKAPPARRPDDWPPQEKLAAVMEAESVAEADLGVWLRRRGLKEEGLELLQRFPGVRTFRWRYFRCCCAIPRCPCLQSCDRWRQKLRGVPWP